MEIKPINKDPRWFLEEKIPINDFVTESLNLFQKYLKDFDTAKRTLKEHKKMLDEDFVELHKYLKEQLALLNEQHKALTITIDMLEKEGGAHWSLYAVKEKLKGQVLKVEEEKKKLDEPLVKVDVYLEHNNKSTAEWWMANVHKHTNTVYIGPN